MPKDRSRQPLVFDASTLRTTTLTRAQLAEVLFERIGLNRREASDMIDAFFGSISETLASGEDVKLSGFGNFSVRFKTARPGRNPRTGEPVHIEARRVVTFRSSAKLRKWIEEAQHNAPDELGPLSR